MTFTREQVLGLLIATAVLLLVIAQIWGPVSSEWKRFWARGIAGIRDYGSEYRYVLCLASV
jgi:hypothetical protein